MRDHRLHERASDRASKAAATTALGGAGFEPRMPAASVWLPERSFRKLQARFSVCRAQWNKRHKEALVKKKTVLIGSALAAVLVLGGTGVAAAVTDKTKLIWLETPTNPALNISDIENLMA